MTTQVRAAALTGYFDVASRLGLETGPILQAAGLSRASLDDPDQRIPVTTVMTLLDEAARASGCQSFGLRIAATRQLADLGAISLLLMHQATLRDALRTLIRYRSLMNESLAMLVEDAGTTVIVREEIVVEDAPVSRQAIELAMGTLHRACSVLLGLQWNPHSVHFTHDAPADLQLHRRMFGCKPKFHSDFNGIARAATEFDHPNPVADPMMAEYARRCLESQSEACATSCVLEVRKAIYLLLPMGQVSIEQVARGWRWRCARCSAGSNRQVPCSPSRSMMCGANWWSGTLSAAAICWPRLPSCSALRCRVPLRAGFLRSLVCRHRSGASGWNLWIRRQEVAGRYACGMAR
ncbi:AraC family transcriptional regulator [Cupriavidus basilensis]